MASLLNIRTLKVRQLKAELNKRSLASTGVKATLIARLKTALDNETVGRVNVTRDVVGVSVQTDNNVPVSAIDKKSEKLDQILYIAIQAVGKEIRYP